MALVFPGGSDGKESACSADSQVQALGWENPLEKEMATHSSILAWKSPWMEEFGRLQSMESQSQTLCLTTTCLFPITVAQLFATKGPDCLAHWSPTLVLTNA